MPTYLRWLTARVEALGGTLTRINLSALPAHADLVVNCTGLGARHLADDPSVTPVAGQVVVVEQFGLERWWLDPAGPTYVIPREHEVVVGGTEQHGEWSRTPSPTRRPRSSTARRAGARGGGRPGAAPQGRSAPGAADGPRSSGRRRRPLLRARRLGRHAVVGLLPRTSSGSSQRPDVDHRGRRSAGRRCAGTCRRPTRILTPRYVEQVGLDGQQHQWLVDVGVVRRPHALDLLLARGVQEPLLLEGPPPAWTSCRHPPPAPAPSRLPWRCGRSASASSCRAGHVPVVEGESVCHRLCARRPRRWRARLCPRDACSVLQPSAGPPGDGSCIPTKGHDATPTQTARARSIRARARPGLMVGARRVPDWTGRVARTLDAWATSGPRAPCRRCS